jgi:mannitol-1-phosphate 5-dehydrogenase
MPTMKSAVMLGAGNVGRGFLGQLFSESGYEVVFVDVDEPLLAALQARGSYTIRLVDNETREDVRIAPVRAIHAGDREAVAGALQTASIGATAVGVRALPQIAPLVAAGIARRAEATMTGPLNLIICENLKDAAATFRTMVREHLAPRHHAYLEANVGFVDTVIGRMVPPLPPDLRAQDPSLVQVEPYKELPVDGSGFVGPPPGIVAMQTRDDFGVYTARKLYLHNGGHAVLGYLGYLHGYTYGYEALADRRIRAALEQALAEGQAGIVAAHDVKSAWLQAHIDDLLHRFGNRALEDTNYRLARDPVRKLGPADRLVGAARLAEGAGLQPDALSLGIAAGYCFDHPDDPIAQTLQQRIAREGLEVVLQDVSQIQPEEPLGRLVLASHRKLRWQRK